MKRSLLVFLSIPLCSLSNFSAAQTEMPPLPRSMASMGDSITAGLFANFRRQDIIYPWARTLLLSEAALFFPKKNIDYLEKQHLSWSTGVDFLGRVASHASRLEKLNGRADLEIFNAAVSGDSSIDLVEQVANVFQWSQETLGQAVPDYVTLMIGPNDACAENTNAMTQIGLYQERVAAALDSLLVAGKNSKVLISVIPNVETLRTVAKNARLLGIAPIARCQNLWELIKLCPTLTTLDDPTERAKVAQRVVDYNFALKQAVDEKVGIYGDRVRLASEPYQIAFSADDLSIDCFHPNTRGQNLLAASSWRSSWWASPSEKAGPLVVPAAVEVEESELRLEAQP